MLRLCGLQESGKSVYNETASLKIIEKGADGGHISAAKEIEFSFFKNQVNKEIHFHYCHLSHHVFFTFCHPVLLMEGVAGHVAASQGKPNTITFMFALFQKSFCDYLL